MTEGIEATLCSLFRYRGKSLLLDWERVNLFTHERGPKAANLPSENGKVLLLFATHDLHNEVENMLKMAC
jgi:hypothetical protein